MDMAYTKLFSSIVTSTIWVEPDRTRIVWITMLAICDKNGEVQASIPGLARLAGVPVEDCEQAISKFLSPDPYSRTPDDEGRRIEKIDGGWALLNHAKYRNMASKEEVKTANCERQKRYREKLKRNASVTPSNASVTHDRDIADAEADADTKNKTLGESVAPSAPTKAKKSDEPDESWLKGLASDQAYAGINVSTEFAKMSRWCEVNRKAPSRRRFINWLNRVEKPLTAQKTFNEPPLRYI